MGIRKIFDNDPEHKQSGQFADDVVGRFRSGAQLNGRPVALDKWRMTTGDPDVADRIAELLGGTPEEWETNSEETTEVYTEAEALDIILDGPKSVKTSMVLWGRKGKIRECDGETQTDDARTPCVCPSSVKERKEAATAGHGCGPSIQVYFRLAAEPDLGRFKFFSQSWLMAEEIFDAEERLEEIAGPAKATLTLVTIKYETKAGIKREFTKPVLDVIGVADDVPSSDEEPF